MKLSSRRDGMSMGVSKSRGAGDESSIGSRSLEGAFDTCGEKAISAADDDDDTSVNTASEIGWDASGRESDSESGSDEEVDLLRLLAGVGYRKRSRVR